MTKVARARGARVRPAPSYLKPSPFVALAAAAGRDGRRYKETLAHLQKEKFTDQIDGAILRDRSRAVSAWQVEARFFREPRRVMSVSNNM